MENNAVDFEIQPGIFVPPAVANFLVRRLDWIKEGGEGPFQVLEPKGFDFQDLCTLADLIANNQSELATKMADNLSRSVMTVSPSRGEKEGSGDDNFESEASNKGDGGSLSLMTVSPSSGEKDGSGDDNFESEASNKGDSGSLGEPLIQAVVGPGVTVDGAVEKEFQLMDLHAKMGEEEEMDRGGGDEDADLEEREEVTGEKEASIVEVIFYFTHILLQFCICSSLF